MREFLSYVLESFQDATGWRRNNGYADLNVTPNELLNFHTPRGLHMTLASLATLHFATAYNLGSIGVVDGSISYLFSSVPLSNVVAQSATVDLPTLLRSYRQLAPVSKRPGVQSTLTTTSAPPVTSSASTLPRQLDLSSPAAFVNSLWLPATEQLARLGRTGRQLVDTPAMLYGRLFLPRSMLEAYLVKRLTSSAQLELRAVSGASLPHGGTILAVLQLDRGTYSLETLASSDGGLLGVRGLYTFGMDDRDKGPGSSSARADGNASESHSTSTLVADDQRLHGQFSAGGEVYYGTLNKSGGLSLGARYMTLPGVGGTPLVAMMTINPLMGNVNATYAVVASEACALATQIGFNVYSYESEWAVGVELWSKRRLAGLVAVDESRGQPEKDECTEPTASDQGTWPSSKPSSPPPQPVVFLKRSFQAKLEWRLDDPTEDGETSTKGGTSGGEIDYGTRVTDDKYQGVLKARLDQNLKLGLLWEGRIKSLLFSLGSGVDLHRPDQPFRTLGLEIQFSS